MYSFMLTFGINHPGRLLSMLHFSRFAAAELAQPPQDDGHFEDERATTIVRESALSSFSR